MDQRGVERDGLSKYLAPIDTDPDDLFSSALAMDDIQTIFGRIEADRVVMFLDSCYSGAAGLGGKSGRTFAPKQTRAMHLDDQFLDRLTRSKGRAIITASRPSEVSIELPELGHGLLTYYLLEGLRGKGDLNRDGIVSLQELYGYLEQQVTQKSRAVGGNQHPVMKGELEGVLPLVRVRGRSRGSGGAGGVSSGRRGGAGRRRARCGIACRRDAGAPPPHRRPRPPRGAPGGAARSRAARALPRSRA